jgi:hypothetical protein
MDWLSNVDWLWKSFVARLIWELALFAGLSSFLVWLNKKRPKLQTKYRPVFITMACICIIWFTITGRPILTPEPTTITEQNIEIYVRSWLDDFGVGVRRVANDKVIFEYEVTVTDTENRDTGVKLKVAQFKPPYDKKLLVHAGIIFNGDTKRIIDSLTRYQKDQIGGLMSMELAKTGVMFSVDSDLKGLDVNRGIHITSTLTDDAFFRELEDVDDAVILAENLLRAQLSLHMDVKPH